MKLREIAELTSNVLAYQRLMLTDWSGSARRPGSSGWCSALLDVNVPIMTLEKPKFATDPNRPIITFIFGTIRKSLNSVFFSIS